MTRDESGDKIPLRDVCDPSDVRDLRQREKASLGQPIDRIALPRAIYEFSVEVAAERFDREHENCGTTWECKGCGQQVCTRCHPSPAEEELCSDCWWATDPEGDAA